MRVVILGSSGQDGFHRQYASSYLINGNVAIDAGCLGFHGTPADQEAVDHVFLTHAHADHIASLPVFLENVYTPSPECPTIYGSKETLSAVQRHVFNEEVWPDFVRLSEGRFPFLRLETVQTEIPIEAAGLRLLPVAVHHTIPTLAYVVSSDQASVIFASDSGPTTRLWEIAHQIPNLKAIFLEVSFPNRMRGLAETTLHLTPEMARAEVAKLPEAVRVFAVHIKERYREEVEAELRALDGPLIEPGVCGMEYDFWTNCGASST